MQQSTNPTGRLLVWLEGSRQKKTLQNFRDYVREHYPWLKLLFVPAACTDLCQPLTSARVSFSDVEFYALLRPLRGRSEF